MSDGDGMSSGHARVDALVKDAHETPRSEGSANALLDARILGVDM